MNLFSTDLFLHTLADVFFPRRRREIALYRVRGHLFRLMRVEGYGLVTRFPFVDFFEPLEDGDPSGHRARRLRFLPQAVTATTRAEDRDQGPRRAGWLASPFVRWSEFPDWAAFEASVHTRIGNLFPDSRRRRNKLERALGPVRFEFDDRRPEVFDACVRWKSAQYKATQVPDMFAQPLNVELFRELHRRGGIVVSTLSAEATLLAVHFGGLADNRHYWWVPAYDADQARFSPGRLMLEEILRESQRRGHAEFDFLKGDEPYKWHYASHNRQIGPLGQPPLSETFRALALHGWRRAAQRFPAIRFASGTLRRLRRRVDVP